MKNRFDGGAEMETGQSMLDCLRFAFNVWDCESARAVIDAAAARDQGVILQTSTSVYKGFDPKAFAAFSKAYAASSGVSMWLNIDHCRDEELLKDAVDSGWDMIMADGSALTLDKNIEFTNRVAEYAHDRGVLVEGEIGQVIGVEDDVVVRDAAKSSRGDIRAFLEGTRVDLAAIAFGNAHGDYVAPPDLDYDLLSYAAGLASVPLVVHGASGLSSEELSRLAALPYVRKINISTDLKQSYLRGLERARKDGLLDSNGFQPVALLRELRESLMQEVDSKLQLAVGC